MSWSHQRMRGGNLFVVAHSARNPSGELWDRYLVDTRVLVQNLTEHIDSIQLLVLSDGGGPDEGQRSRLNELLAGTRVKVAVVSGDFLARTVVMASALFNSGVRVFSPGRLDAALEYLGLEASEFAPVLDLIREVGEGLSSGKTVNATLRAAG